MAEVVTVVDAGKLGSPAIRFERPAGHTAGRFSLHEDLSKIIFEPRSARFIELPPMC
jgi:hypothetical protein